MSKLFRNDSPGAKTLEQARAEEIKRHRDLRRQAAEIAAQGRGEDTEIAHVALGEMMIPEMLQTPEFMAALRRAAEAEGIPIEQLRVGSRHNSINPETGAAEFDPHIYTGPIDPGIEVKAEAITNPPSPLTDGQRKLLDTMNGPASRLGRQYGFNPDNLLGLMGVESSWLANPEGVEKNNPFGVNVPGTKTLRTFPDVDSAFDYWGKVFGSQLSGLNSTDEFVKGLRKLRAGPYNSVNPDYDSLMRDTIDSVKLKKPYWEPPSS